MAKIVPALDLEKLKPKRLEVIFYIYIYVVTATDYFSPDSSSLVLFLAGVSQPVTLWPLHVFVSVAACLAGFGVVLGFCVTAFNMPPVSESRSSVLFSCLKARL